MSGSHLVFVFIVLQVLFDIVVVFLLFFLASRRRLEKKDLERVLAVEERIKTLIEDKAKEIGALQDAVVYEKDRAIKELKKLELEVERKMKLLSDAVSRKEEEKKKKRELVKHLLSKGKSPAEVAKELDMPLSEVKFIAELMGKAGL